MSATIKRRPDLSLDQIEVIRDWATRCTSVSAVWIFGSRAKGISRPDSDLDVAVEIEPLPGMTARQTYGRDLAWHEWADDLEEAIAFRVHFFLLDGANTPKVAAAVLEHGVEIFRRRR